MAIPDLSTIEQRSDGFYHNGKKIKNVITKNPQGELSMVQRANHEKGTLELVLHLNYGWLVGGTWSRTFTYEDGSESEPIS